MPQFINPVVSSSGYNLSMDKKQELAVYQAENGAIELRTDATSETIWATQKQLAHIFGVEIPTINEHIKNIFKTEELQNNDSVIRKFLITAADGKNYNTNHYNLDMILSVGYRVSSKSATNFRKWSTQTLKQYILNGYVINQTRVQENNEAFIETISGMGDIIKSESPLKSGMSLISTFADTWLSLESYDKDELPKKGGSLIIFCG